MAGGSGELMAPARCRARFRQADPAAGSRCRLPRMTEHHARIGCQIELLHVTDLVSHSPVLGQVIPPRSCRRLNKASLQRTRIADRFYPVWAGERAIVDRNGIAGTPDRCQI